MPDPDTSMEATMNRTETRTLVFAVTTSGTMTHLRAVEDGRRTLCGHDADDVPEWWPFDASTCSRCLRRKVWLAKAGYEVEGP